MNSTSVKKIMQKRVKYKIEKMPLLLFGYKTTFSELDLSLNMSIQPNKTKEWVTLNQYSPIYKIYIPEPM